MLISDEQPSKIRVRVLFFGAARDAVGHEEIGLALIEPHNAARAREQLLAAYPELQRFGKSLLFAVNQEYARPDQEIAEGDELAVFPPVSGGSGAGSADVSPARTVGQDFFELTTNP